MIGRVSRATVRPRRSWRRPAPATLADVLPGPGDPPLRVLFCGINPGLVSAATGHHFARPGNRFWPALHGAGFTPRRLLPAEQGELAAARAGRHEPGRPGHRAGRRAHRRPSCVAGGERLRELVARTGPAWLAVVGITAYRTAFGAPHAAVGPQPEPLGATRVWVLPNPSGLNAHYQLPALVAEFARLRRAAAAPRGANGTVAQ